MGSGRFGFLLGLPSSKENLLGGLMLMFRAGFFSITALNPCLLARGVPDLLGVQRSGTRCWGDEYHLLIGFAGAGEPCIGYWWM